jgi:TfoX/Sxy family transcriptional regulator of competence genes
MSRATLETLQEQLRAAVAVIEPRLEVVFRPMFGGACGYVKGRVFASVSDVGLALKLPATVQEDFLREGAKRLQYQPDMPPSKHYLVVPARFREDAEALAEWARHSIDHVLAQPAPRAKRRKSS